MAAAAASRGDGCAPAFSGPGGSEAERAESEGEKRGAAGRLQTRRGRLGGKQEVAGAASALATELLRGEGEEDDRRVAWWAGPATWAARWASQVS